MGGTAWAIGRCLEAGNEERAIGFVKALETSGGRHDLEQLRSLDATAPTRLRYYIRKGIRAIECRLEADPGPRTPTPPPSIRHRPPLAVERTDAPVSSKGNEPGSADPERLAADFGNCVSRTPGRRMPVNDGALPDNPLKRDELVALASHLDSCIERIPARRFAVLRRDVNPLDRIAVDRLADLFRTIVDERPGLRFGSPEPSDVAAAPIASALREIAAEQAALAEIEFAQFDLDPAVYSRLDRSLDASDIAV